MVFLELIELKKKFFVKEKKISFVKKNFFYKTQIIHVHLYSVFIPSFRIFIIPFPETLLCYALKEVIDVIHFFLSKYILLLKSSCYALN